MLEKGLGERLGARLKEVEAVQGGREGDQQSLTELVAGLQCHLWFCRRPPRQVGTLARCHGRHRAGIASDANVSTGRTEDGSLLAHILAANLQQGTLTHTHHTHMILLPIMDLMNCLDDMIPSLRHTRAQDA